MESKNEKKPINVLTEFLAAWIRANSTEDAAPYDSFETLASRRVGQKDVERWVFNCNYLYYRIGEFLLEHDLLGDGPDQCVERLAFLEQNFKSIKDSNPLNLRSKQNDAIEREFAKDWPPLCEGSRNQLARLERALGALGERYADDLLPRQAELDALLLELADERDFYQDLAADAGDKSGRDALLERCRRLLPLWCVKQVSPLYSLLIWDDRDAVERLAQLLADSFEDAGFPSYDGSRKQDSYIGLVLRAQEAYSEGLGEDELDLHDLTVRELWDLLEAEFFSLEHPSGSKRIPAWLLGKAQLIWNVAVCSILGPREAICGSSPARTMTSEVERPDDNPDELSGEVLLRRRFNDGRLETVDRLSVDEVQTSGLWKVIGSVYDENAALPRSEYRNHYDNLGSLFIGSRRFDRSGRLVEGAGDSRFHAELSIRMDEKGGRRIILRDLGSKNGTYVIRQEGGETRYYLLKSRSSVTTEGWCEKVGVSPSQVSLVDWIALRRRDIIQLCGSSFEII